MKIASRTLTLEGPSKSQVRIDIFAPEHDGKAWKCNYEIHWPKRSWTSFAGGVDSVQALVLAIQKIGLEIYFSDYHKSGKLSWDGPGKGYGFPVAPAARDILIGDDIKYY